MKVGFIGLGIMGRPMTENLLEAGYELVVNDFNKDAVADVASCGAATASGGAEAASQCEIIIIMIPNFPHVRAAALGEGGITEGAKPGIVLTDMSPIDSTESKATSVELAKKGIEMMDRSVSGGEPEAIDGILFVMCGGKKELFNKYYDMLIVTADSMVYAGELGSGSMAKLADQIVVAVNIAVMSEALTFTKKAGTDPELVYQAIHGGLAGSTVMDTKAPMMLARNSKLGSHIELHIKDLNNALSAAYAISSPAPLTGQLMEIMQGLKADGSEKEDHSSIVKYYEKITNTTMES